MKYTKTILTATLCVSLVTGVAFSQSRASEGLSRQVISLKKMMETFANDIRPRVSTLETDVSALQDRENDRTTCNNISGDSSIYWPNHPEADATTGCVSHSELGSGDTNIAGGCTNRSVSWQTAHNTCSAMAPPTPQGVNVTVTKTIPYCDQGRVGTAVFQCVDGNFILQSGTCSYQNNFGECR